jgi:hypothetical protein
MSHAISAAKADGPAFRGESGLTAQPNDRKAALDEFLAWEESSVNSAAFEDATSVPE